MIGTAAYWEEEAARFADYFVKMHAVVVTGADTEACAHVGIGIARVHSRERKIVLVDLAGDLAPLQHMVKATDALGLSDYLLYGASTAKTVHRLDMNPNMYVMPSGAEPSAIAELPGDERWRALVDGFKAENALMVLVAPLDAPGLKVLTDGTNGVIGVGGLARAKIGDRNMLVHIDPPSHGAQGKKEPIKAETTGPRFGRSGETRSPAAPAGTAAATPERRGQPRGVSAPRPDGRPAWMTPWHLVGGAVTAALLIAGIAWLLLPKSRNQTADALDAPVAHHVIKPAPPPPTIDTTAAGDTLPLLAAANPEDSASASVWSIQLLEANTPEGARGEMDRLPKSIAVRTVSPVLLSAEAGTWYRVMLGAFGDKTGADSLYNALQSQDVLQPGAQVVQAPYALLLKDKVTARELPKLLKFYAQKHIAVYTLHQADGRTTLYSGAYTSPKDAGLLALTIQQAGVAPVLVFRTGR